MVISQLSAELRWLSGRRLFRQALFRSALFRHFKSLLMQKFVAVSGLLQHQRWFIMVYIGSAASQVDSAASRFGCESIRPPFFDRVKTIPEIHPIPNSIAFADTRYRYPILGMLNDYRIFDYRIKCSYWPKRQDAEQ